MRKYSINNSLLNYDIFTILFIIIIPFLFLLPNASFLLIIIITIVIIFLFLLAIRQFRKRTFELKFEDNGIIVDYFNLNFLETYNYDDLVSITYIQKGKGISINKFVFLKEQQTKTYKTPLIESGEDFVNFIKDVKAKNKNFKTFVYPKGSLIHMRIRQELLGTEF